MKEKDYKTMKNQLAELEQENSQLKVRLISFRRKSKIVQHQPRTTNNKKNE